MTKQRPIMAEYSLRFHVVEIISTPHREEIKRDLEIHRSMLSWQISSQSFGGFNFYTTFQFNKMLLSYKIIISVGN